jgi:hypothetical protein
MVSLRLPAASAGAGRAAVAAAALIVAAACRREAPPPATGAQAGNAAEIVRARYAAPDAEAAGAWVWNSRDSLTYVLVDAQSAVQGIVQGRAELWLANDHDAALYGRSEALPSVASIGAYNFEDLSGDDIPDLLGFVSDSAEVSYPVFIPGSRAGMTEELAIAAQGWRFSTEEDHVPRPFSENGVTCALQLWVEENAPDNGPPGWRWLVLERNGNLHAPMATAPSCAPVGVQPGTSRP